MVVLLGQAMRCRVSVGLSSPRIVVLTGIDGSGKTTHARHLVRYLREKGVKATLIQQFASPALSRTTTPGSVGTLKQLERNASLEMHFATDRSRGSHFVRTLVAPFAVLRIVAAGISRTSAKILANKSSHILVFDRYFYDDLIKAVWMFGLSIRLADAVASAVPEPTVLFYLHASAEGSWSREKGNDRTQEQHRRKKMAYDIWFSRMREKHKNFYQLDTEKEKVSYNFSRIVQILHEHVGENR